MEPGGSPARATDPDDTHRRRVDRDLLLASLAALLVAAALQVAPARDGVTLLGWRLPEVCVTKRLVDVGCPACGLTRSVVATVHGEWRDALRLHPVGPLLVALAAAQVPFRAARLLRGRSRPPTAAGRRLVPALAGAALVVWVVRIAAGGSP
ncbi:MAG: DUF2752 domain-containing protein [Planctomycetes bacterium]|nr:DUF2752 domain-containing protein [Planctomycetota bacterium]